MNIKRFTFKWNNQYFKEIIKRKISVKAAFFIFFIILVPYFIQYIQTIGPDLEKNEGQTYLFSIDSTFQTVLDSNRYSGTLQSVFKSHKRKLSPIAKISTGKVGREWLIVDNLKDVSYPISKNEGQLDVYIQPYKGLGIKSLIRKVKEELKYTELAMEEDEDPLFMVKDFELEISFVVHTSYTMNGTIEYHFITVDSEYESSIEKIQRIKLHMTTIPSKPENFGGSTKLKPFNEDEVINPDKLN